MNSNAHFLLLLEFLNFNNDNIRSLYRFQTFSHRLCKPIQNTIQMNETGRLASKKKTDKMRTKMTLADTFYWSILIGIELMK